MHRFNGLARACIVVATLASVAPRPAAFADPAPAKPAPAETSYADRTDGFEEKMAMLEAAWRAWARGWRFCKAVHLDETAGLDRASEPVELLVSCPAEQATALAREIRMARVVDGTLREVPSQTYGEVRRAGERLAKVLFMADVAAQEKQTYLVFYGNPDAELPTYPTDMATRGEGFALDVENAFYTASLSRQMGQLERMTLKREHGLQLFAGGDGHGEPPGIDWAHDYVTSGNFQKMRVTLWETCPDYEVVRGPLCTIVRRWGFPHSPVHPVFTPSRLNIDVEYRFYAGLPWFLKVGSMQATEDFEVTALRDDEWVFSGQSFREIAWMGQDGKVESGPVRLKPGDQLAGIGFANRESRDSFFAMFLEHRAEGLPELNHSVAVNPFYRWHGSEWERYPLRTKNVPAGAVLHQKNAYAVVPFDGEDGPRAIEELRSRLVKPLAASAGDPPRDSAAAECPGRLARPGEAGDSPIPKQAIWDALHDCKDEQLYGAGISIVDLGLVHDVRVRGETVQVVMSMPHRGRPRLGYFAHGSGGNSTPVRQRLSKVPGVKHVVVEQTWEPGWNSNRLTDEGRRKLGLTPLMR